ncbi:dihydrolipoyllysine-residue succinyltransferase component of 2-oxoglutarate dehydrogenase complex 2, mitochondrial-like [Arachis stenosperma]|nr:dihydrolipoyllysine-residue succinyltransferase component of 2-oxoglutarate dehydrogenase complex 2, mitochondrial-like [Arachis stenosperma]
MMFDVVRRRSFQMFLLGRCVQKKFRYGSSLRRISSIKMALHSGGCGSVQNFYHRSSLEEDVVDVLVPPLAESISDGTLAKFLKNPGDSVSVDEPIAQIETDKVTIDVPSPTTGIILKLVVNEGDTVKPGHKVAIISTSAEVIEQDSLSSSSSSSSSSSESESEEDSPQPSQKIIEKKKAPNVEATPKRIETSITTAPQPPPKKGERRVPMTRLRKRVMTRLKDSQNTYAMLTTFNELDMTNLMKLRSDYKEVFVEKHGVKLGLMSCFIKAAISALQHQPIVNAVIDGDDIVYRDYIDISVAVATAKGLVVPVIRNAEKMELAEIENQISCFGKKANNGTLSIDEMVGGTLTISNGGVYGSLLSTPIINPPQSAILGMHSIMSRPMMVGGNIVPRPMMYIALTYDHRIIDGREAVYFLRHIKDIVEDPRRLLLDL